MTSLSNCELPGRVVSVWVTAALRREGSGSAKPLKVFIHWALHLAWEPLEEMIHKLFTQSGSQLHGAGNGSQLKGISQDTHFVCELYFFLKILLLFSKISLTEIVHTCTQAGGGARGEGVSRLPAQQEACRRAPSQDPEVMT